MTTATTHVVELQLKRRGDFGAADIGRNLDGLDRRVRKSGLEMVSLGDRAKKAFGDFGHRVHGGLRNLESGLDSVARKVGSLAMVGGGLALAGGIGAATYGVTHLNSELETTRISLGAIFNANGMANSLDQGIERASEGILKMRKLAADLPGEFGDLLDIMTTTAIPSFQAGASLDEQRNRSAKFMAAGVVAKLPLDMVAREAAQLIQGRAGAHNVLGMRLMGLHGDDAKEFNQLPMEKRMARIDAELDKYSGSISEFSKTYEGISSTLLDNLKERLRGSTEPLFERVKVEMAGINAWFDENETQVNIWTRRLGDGLVSAFEWGRRKLLLWGPPLMEFAGNARDAIMQASDALAPIGETIREALRDPGTIDKLITLGKIWLSVKGLNMAVSLGGAVGGAVKGGYGAARAGFGALAAGGGGFSAGAALWQVAGAGMGGAGTGAGLRTVFGSIASAGQSVVGMFGQLARWAGPIGVGTSLLLAARDEVQSNQAKPQSFKDRIASDAKGMFAGKSAAEVSLIYDQMRDKLGTAWNDADSRRTSRSDMVNQDLWNRGLENILDPTAQVGKAMAEVAEAGLGAAWSLEELERSVLDQGAENSKAIGDWALNQGAMMMMQRVNDQLLTPKTKRHRDRPKHPSTRTNIQKVEIVVTTNESPGRLARRVKDELLRVVSPATRSPHVPDFGAPLAQL